MVAAAVVGSAVVGAGTSIYAGDQAASAQEDAANQATNTQMGMFNKVQKNLQPYMDLGQLGNTNLTSRLTELTSPITMDQATLERTPGYQFNLNQGLKAVQNSAAARGLGTSGAALKGAAGYATGLADSTYQNQFNNMVTNQTNAYNRLLSLSQLGENAAAGVGNAGVTTGANIANNITGAANAQAANYMNTANAIGNAGNNLTGGLLTNKLLNGGLYSSPSGLGPLPAGSVDLGNAMPWGTQI